MSDTSGTPRVAIDNPLTAQSSALPQRKVRPAYGKSRTGWIDKAKALSRNSDRYDGNVALRFMRGLPPSVAHHTRRKCWLVLRRQSWTWREALKGVSP
jgi:hypothetical protein